MKAPRSSFSRNCNRMEYILRTTDLHLAEVAALVGWLVCGTERERERERGGRKEGRRHEAHFPEEMAFMAFIAFTPFFHEAQNKNPLSRFEDCMLTSTD